MKIGTFDDMFNALSENATGHDWLDVYKKWIDPVIPPILDKLGCRAENGDEITFRVGAFGRGVSIQMFINGKYPSNRRVDTFELPLELWEHLYNLLIEEKA